MVNTILRYLLIIFILSSTLNSDEFIARDKQLHVVVGTGIYLGCLFFAGIAHNNNIEWINAKTCLVPVYLSAIGKEVYDKHNGGTAEFSDITATGFVPSTGYILYEW